MMSDDEEEELGNEEEAEDDDDDVDVHNDEETGDSGLFERDAVSPLNALANFRIGSNGGNNSGRGERQQQTQQQQRLDHLQQLHRLQQQLQHCGNPNTRASSRQALAPIVADSEMLPTMPSPFELRPVVVDGNGGNNDHNALPLSPSLISVWVRTDVKAGTKFGPYGCKIRKDPITSNFSWKVS